MSIILNPLLSGANSYNVGIAETHSWVPIDNNVNRPLFARAIYPVAKSGGFTQCQTLTSGIPSFISKQIVVHNTSNNDVQVRLTLTSGASCDIPIGKNSSQNHILILDLAVLQINDYSGCQITFFS